MQAKVILCKLLPSFIFRLPDGYKIEIAPQANLQPKDKVPTICHCYIEVMNHVLQPQKLEKLINNCSWTCWCMNDLDLYIVEVYIFFLVYAS